MDAADRVQARTVLSEHAQDEAVYRRRVGHGWPQAGDRLENGCRGGQDVLRQPARGGGGDEENQLLRIIKGVGRYQVTKRGVGEANICTWARRGQVRSGPRLRRTGLKLALANMG